jgi:peptide/nickel transport system ATP-binding protein
MNPLILLADEPTTSLDAAVQAQIMELLAGIKAKTDTSVLFVTHDLSLVKNYADRVLIMRDGRIVESGDTAHIFSAPAGDYTKKLILFSGYGDGSAHTHGNIHFHEGVPHSHGTPGGNDAPLLSMKRVSKYYEMGRRKTLRVLDDINIDIYEGEIVGLCGRSGIGKSTLARCLIGLEGVSAGEIHYGMSLKAKNAMQMIFQDSKSAMNPRMTVAEIIGEPLRLERGKRPPEEEIARLMEDVELDESLLHRYPHEISGGQRQRVAIARAISTKPAFLIADEPMSSLDVTIRAQIVHLLKKIKEDRALTMLLISHDLPMLLHISDRIYDLP